MDADERQQLKTNELAERLLKLREIAQKYGNQALTALTVLLLAFAAYRFWSWRQESATNRAWADISSVNVYDASAGDAPLDQLRQVIANAPTDAIRSVGRLRLASGLLEKTDDANGPARVDEAIRELQAVLTTSGVDRALRGAALLKLATAQESKRDFAAARQSYQQIIGDSAFEGLPFRTLADDRVASLDALSNKVAFTPGSAPKPAPVSQPAAAATTAPAVAETPPAATTPPTGAAPPPTASPLATPAPTTGPWELKLEPGQKITDHPLFARKNPNQPTSEQAASAPASQPAAADAEKKP